MYMCVHIFHVHCVCIHMHSMLLILHVYTQANDGNVEITSEETRMDVVGLRLLSTRRNFENVSSYGPSSSH